MGTFTSICKVRNKRGGKEMKEVDGGVVVKVTEKQIVLFCNNGTFKNIPRSKNHFPLIGERISYKGKTKLFQPKGWMALASIACLLFLMFTMVPIKDAEAAYIVAFDINPSIEVYLDENLKGMSIVSLNSDGSQIVSKINYKGKDLSQIVNLIIDQCVKQHYLSSDGNSLVATTIIPTQDERKITQSQLKSLIQTSLKQHKVTADIDVELGSKKMVKVAHENNLSVNKYKEYKDLKDQGVDISLETARSTPMNQLVKKEKKKNNQSDKNPSNNKNQNKNNQSNNNQGNNKGKDKQNSGQAKKNENKPNQNNQGQNNKGQNNSNKEK